MSATPSVTAGLRIRRYRRSREGLCPSFVRIDPETVPETGPRQPGEGGSLRRAGPRTRSYRGPGPGGAPPPRLRRAVRGGCPVPTHSKGPGALRGDDTSRFATELSVDCGGVLGGLAIRHALP